MKINDRAFDGSTSYLETVKRLQAVAGKTSWFSEFSPTRFRFRETMYLLMSAFLKGGNCFYFSGTFIYYLAGILDAFKGVTLYITLTHLPYMSTFSKNRIIHVLLFWFHI